MIEMERANQLLDVLKNWGCNTEEAMDRLMDDKENFIEFLFQFIEDEKFMQLELAIQQGNKIQAVEYAHALKGIAANLSLTPIYNSISFLVEAIRSEETIEIENILKDVIDKKNELCAITKKI